MTRLQPGVSARAHRATDPLHSMIYFCPEAEEEFTAIGLRPGRMPYFASRSAPMGAVSGGVTAATFYNFNPALVAKMIPRAWTLASPEQIVAARWTVAGRALRRLLGDAADSASYGSSPISAAPPASRSRRRTVRSTRVMPIWTGRTNRCWCLARGDAAARVPRRRPPARTAHGRTVRPRGHRDALRDRTRIHRRGGQAPARLVGRAMGVRPGRPRRSRPDGR